MSEWGGLWGQFGCLAFRIIYSYIYEKIQNRGFNEVEVYFSLK